MAKEVKFNIKLTIDGKDKLVSATTDVHEFAEAFEKAKAKSTQLRDNLLKFNQTVQAIENVTGGLKQATGIFEKFAVANRDNIEVQTKLATNMRNMMGASDGEVESIRKLCEAEQGLGVISDDIQMQGAQELATYLEKKSSLEQLIPVMNDMVAQQYGFNATQEAAQNIATMLGKVMDGQVGALSRYGYKFDEVQEQILKFGTEEQRAAVLADVVSSAVGGMNHELGQTDTGRMMQLKETVNGVKDAIGEAYDNIAPLMMIIGEAGGAITGIVTAYNGLKGVVVTIKSMTAATLISNAATKAAAIANKLWAYSSTLMNRAAIMWTFSAKAASVATTAFSVAIKGLMIATGVGIVIAAVTTVVQALSSSFDKTTESIEGFTESADDSASAIDSERQAIENQRVVLGMHIQKLKEFNGTKEEEKALVKEMNSTYGATMGYFSSVSDWYKALTANSEDYCKQMIIEAQTRQYANQIAEIQTQMDDIVYDQYGSKRKYSTVDKTQKKAHYDQAGRYLGSFTEKIENSSDKAVAQKQYNDLQKQKQAKQNLLNKTVSDGGKIKMSVKGAASPRDLDLKTPKGTGSTNKETPPAVDGSVRWYKEQIDKLDKQISEAANEETAKHLVVQKKKLEDEYKNKKIRIGIETDDTALEGSIDWYEKEIRSLDSQIAAASDLNAARQLMETKKVLEQELQGKKIEIGLELPDIAGDEDLERNVTIKSASEPDKIMQGDDWDKRKSYQNAQQLAGQIQSDLEIGLIGDDVALERLAELNVQLEKLGLNPVHIDVETKDIDKAKEKFANATDAIGQMGSSLSSMGDTLELPELDVAGTIAQAIASVAQGYATANAQAGNAGPWAWLAFSAVGLAQMMAVISSIKSATAFANGGIVSGPTYALVGEYAGASNNPEVIAPLDKLRSMLQPVGVGGGKVELRARGRSLVGVMANETRIASKSGRRTNIKI